MDRLAFLQLIGALMFAETPGDEGGGDAPKGAEGGDGDNPKSADEGDDEKLGEGGVKALRSERKRASEAEKRASAAEARLKEIEDAEKSEIQREKERADELAAKLAKFETAEGQRTMRANVLAAKKVPSEWAGFVTGETEDEMNAAADQILQNLSGGDGPTLHPTKGQPGGSIEAGREAAKNFR